MTTLSHRERVLKALNHEETDRVPIDLGGALPTKIDAAPYRELVRLLGIENEAEATEASIVGGFVAVTPPEGVLSRLDVDFRELSLGSSEERPNAFLDENSYRDEWGVIWVRAGEGRPFIDKLGPFQESEPTLAEMERHPWPDPRDPGRIRGLKEQAERLRRETDCAVVLNLPYCVLRELQRMRGFEQAMADLLVNPALAEGIMEHALEVSAGIAVAALEEIGDSVDVVMFPEDMGTQNQLFMRPELYRKMVKPYHRRMVEAIKGRTRAKVLLHSDGAVYEAISDFIDIGIDALNPVQVSAKGLGDTRKLKTEFGRDLCFWGAIDTQRVLPYGTPEDVADEVRRRIDDLALGGGYVLASVHTINAEVPGANVLAMLETAKSYRPGRE